MKKVSKLLVMLIVVFMLVNFCNVKYVLGEYSIKEANLYEKEQCGQLLKRDGVIIRATLVVYRDGEIEYPAYCLEKEKPGVGEQGAYQVEATEMLQNVRVWRAITNGYPYKNISQLGCANEKEAYMATKMAVYSMLYGYTIDNFEPIGEAGQRTWNALNKILYQAENGEESKILPEIKIEAENEIWKLDEKDNRYVSKVFKMVPNGNIQQYQVKINGEKLDGTKIVNLDNKEQQIFSSGEKFKVLLPIAELRETGKMEIEVNSQIETKPILVGKAPNSGWQDYALTGNTLEDSKGKLDIFYTPNETEIKIVKMDVETKEKLKGVTFQLLDENKKIIYDNLVTNEKGEVTISHLLPGTYFIKEAKTLENYAVNHEETKIELRYNEEFTVKIYNTKEVGKPNIEIEKQYGEKEISQKEVVSKKLPQTGM